MKVQVKWLAIASLMVPFAAIAAAPVQSTFPDIVTASGVEFVARCDDSAFAKTNDTEGLAKKCDRLLAQWKMEADLRHSAHRNGPRAQVVARLAPEAERGLPFDTVAMLREMPLQASWSSR